jgi:hypothetical protein
MHLSGTQLEPHGVERTDARERLADTPRLHED